MSEPRALSVPLPGVVSRTGWQLPKDMSLDEWIACGQFLGQIEGAVQWWLGDWWAYGEHAYGERTKAAEQLDYDFTTLATYGWVARSVETSCRNEVLSFKHHHYVAALPPDEQKKWLARAAEGDDGEPWTTRQLKAALDARSIAGTIAPPRGRFSCIVIDPPWPMEKIAREVRPKQVTFDYPTMSEEKLQAFDVPGIAADDCHLFCWTTQKFMPMALRLVEHWGFAYILEMVWRKPGGFQPYGLPQFNCEFVIYARKGAPKFIATDGFHCCFDGPRREHSRKPDEFYNMVRRVTDGPRIDVFSREPREGFAQYGNETAKFGEVAA